MPTSRGPKSTEWAREPHTKAKHDLMQKYLGGWFPVLGRWNGRVVFFDGFAGPGSYAKGEMGSPLIAIETLLDHPLFERFSGTEFLFLFCEPMKDRAAALSARLEEFAVARGGLAHNVKYDVAGGDVRRGGRKPHMNARGATEAARADVRLHRSVRVLRGAA